MNIVQWLSAFGTSFPAANEISNVADEGEAKTSLENLVAASKELPGGSAESELTIASGSVTPTSGAHSIDTESDASADDLTNIATTNHPDGRLLLIHAENAARVVTVKHNAGGAGQIALAGGADVSLDSTDKWILLKRTGADWEEVALKPTGSIVQSVRTTDTTHQTGTGTIPLDNTKPQNTEGDQILSRTITPKSPSNKLRVNISVCANHSAANHVIILALFKDSDADCIAAQPFFTASANGPTPHSFSFEMDAGTLSQITFKVRIGGDVAGTWAINGNSSTGWFNGTIPSSITIDEIAA